MWWIALWLAATPFTVDNATMTLEVDSNTYIVAETTSEAVSHAINFLGDVDDSIYKIFRLKEQGITFNSNGTVKLSLKAGTPVEFMLLWNRNGYVQPVMQTVNLTDPTVHYSVATSSTALVNYIQARHAIRGETCKVYLGNEYAIKPELNLWLRAK